MKRLMIIIGVFVALGFPKPISANASSYDSNASVSFYGEYISNEKKDQGVTSVLDNENNTEMVLPKTGESNIEHYIGLLLFIVSLFLFWRNYGKQV